MATFERLDTSLSLTGPGAGSVGDCPQSTAGYTDLSDDNGGAELPLGRACESIRDSRESFSIHSDVPLGIGQAPDRRLRFRGTGATESTPGTGHPPPPHRLCGSG